MLETMLEKIGILKRTVLLMDGESNFIILKGITQDDIDGLESLIDNPDITKLPLDVFKPHLSKKIFDELPAYSLEGEEMLYDLSFNIIEEIGYTI